MWSKVSVWQPWYCQPLASETPIAGSVGVQAGLVVVEEVVLLEVVVLEVMLVEVEVLEVIVLEVVVLEEVLLEVEVLEVLLDFHQ